VICVERLNIQRISQPSCGSAGGSLGEWRSIDRPEKGSFGNAVGIFNTRSLQLRRNRRGRSAGGFRRSRLLNLRRDCLAIQGPRGIDLLCLLAELFSDRAESKGHARSFPERGAAACHATWCSESHAGDKVNRFRRAYVMGASSRYRSLSVIYRALDRSRRLSASASRLSKAPGRRREEKPVAVPQTRPFLPFRASISPPSGYRPLGLAPLPPRSRRSRGASAGVANWTTPSGFRLDGREGDG